VISAWVEAACLLTDLRTKEEKVALDYQIKVDNLCFRRMRHGRGGSMPSYQNICFRNIEGTCTLTNWMSHVLVPVQATWEASNRIPCMQSSGTKPNYSPPRIITSGLHRPSFWWGSISEWFEHLAWDLEHLVSLLTQGKKWSVYKGKGAFRRFTKVFCPSSGSQPA
jgi:hypothetical protein